MMNTVNKEFPTWAASRVVLEVQAFRSLELTEFESVRCVDRRVRSYVYHDNNQNFSRREKSRGRIEAVLSPRKPAPISTLSSLLLDWPRASPVQLCARLNPESAGPDKRRHDDPLGMRLRRRGERAEDKLYAAGEPILYLSCNARTMSKIYEYSALAKNARLHDSPMISKIPAFGQRITLIADGATPKCYFDFIRP